jgi:glycosyltransferase involved in cell wall biosynthesis
MRIGIISTHSHPIPTPTHTGDVVIVDLAQALDDLGHEVTLYAPEGTRPPTHGRVLPMLCSHGQPYPLPRECEQTCFGAHAESMRSQDVVHDFSVTKFAAESLLREGRRNVVSTPMGGIWNYPDPPINVVAWSEQMRGRGLRGAGDYEDSPDLGMSGPPQRPIKDAHVVYGGIDTDWYTPGYRKEGFFLWMNRWHRAKGYQVAIELARRMGIELVMAGEHPDREWHDYQRGCVKEAQELAAGLPNVRFEWLPGDPHHHEAKRELYRRARALLYTVQFQEPFGLSQAESLACGTPVIGTRYGSVPEVVEDGLTGFVRSDDLDDLATALGPVDGIDPRTCRSRAVERFDRHVMAESYLEEYRAAIDGRTWGE